MPESCFCGRQEGCYYACFACKWPAFVWTSTKNGKHRTQFNHTRLVLLLTSNLITRDLTICHVKLMQSTALEEKRFDLRSLSPALRNPWLLLVEKI